MKLIISFEIIILIKPKKIKHIINMFFGATNQIEKDREKNILHICKKEKFA
jgi:hypothetical protein